MLCHRRGQAGISGSDTGIRRRFFVQHDLDKHVEGFNRVLAGKLLDAVDHRDCRICRAESVRSSSSLNIGVPFSVSRSPPVISICVDPGPELNLLCSILGLESLLDDGQSCLGYDGG